MNEQELARAIVAEQRAQKARDGQIKVAIVVVAMLLFSLFAAFMNSPAGRWLDGHLPSQSDGISSNAVKIVRTPAFQNSVGALQAAHP